MDKHKNNVSWGRAAIAAAAMLVVIAGCHKVTGGGWIAGVNGGKATFGFQAQCKSGEPVDFGFGPLPVLDFFVGQFQYHDKGANVSFHGDIIANNGTIGFSGSCRDLADLIFANEDIAVEIGENVHEAEITGECVSHPGDVQGTFKVTVVDNGRSGPDASDEITVTTPNFFLRPIYECTEFSEDGSCANFVQVGEEVVTLGLPCTANGEPYSNSGALGGGNIVMPGHKDAGSSAKKKG